LFQAGCFYGQCVKYSNAWLSGRADFTWQAEADRYLCPGGTSLQRYRRNFKKQRTGITKAGTIIYRASEHACKTCEQK
jgi:hypothetical protein